MECQKIFFWEKSEQVTQEGNNRSPEEQLAEGINIRGEFNKFVELGV